MDWLTRMNDALDWIEKHMEEPMGMEEIAKAAYSSPFHFQRMFYMLTGMTVAEYIRKRRLTLAAHELAASTLKVVDVALKYGYDSPESFSKAFRKIHGVPPSEARRPGAPLKAFPRMSFHISRKGEKEVDYRIEQKEAFTVAGKCVQLKCNDPAYTRQHFWRDCSRDGTLAALAASGSGQPLLGMTMDVQEDFTYMIASSAPASAEPGTEAVEFTVRTVPASAWAIFTADGPLPGSMKSVFERIYQEWFPSTGYEHSGGPEIEVYLPGDASSEDYRCEVWIPIVKK